MKAAHYSMHIIARFRQSQLRNRRGKVSSPDALAGPTPM